MDAEVGPVEPGETDEEGDGIDPGAPFDVPDAGERADSQDSGIPSSRDAASPANDCYLDSDGDGYGAGAALVCDRASALALVLRDGDCDDTDSRRSPGLSDVCGDLVDNDCDDVVDDESNNPCGGACATQFLHVPGESCSNGLLGACSRNGVYRCEGDSAVVCSAESAAASSEVCGNGIDDNCNGETDEPSAVDARHYYPDCDGDGYTAVSRADDARAVRSCLAPVVAGCAGWIETLAQPGTSVDCDDTSAGYHPGADWWIIPTGKTSGDLNCDGSVEKLQAGVGSGVKGISFAFTYRLCDASATCLQCNGNPGPGIKWLDANGNPTNTQPRCSASTTDSFPSLYGNNVCTNGFERASFFQLCR